VAFQPFRRHDRAFSGKVGTGFPVRKCDNTNKLEHSVSLKLNVL
jgi:hypothetical protein